MPRTEEATTLSDGFLAEIREQLAQSRSALTEQNATIDDTDPVTPSLQHAIDEVDAALARLDGGTFGACTRCSRLIPAERIEVMPAAEHCVQCQHEHETRAS